MGSLHNPDFKPLEYEGFRNQAGANVFTMSPKKWIDATQAIGIISKSGCYGGTFAHSDIAFELIKTNLIPPDLTPEQISFTCASEADLLNVTLFGKTAKQCHIDRAGKAAVKTIDCFA